MPAIGELRVYTIKNREAVNHKTSRVSTFTHFIRPKYHNGFEKIELAGLLTGTMNKRLIKQQVKNKSSMQYGK
jgi:hypothetical protein